MGSACGLTTRAAAAAYAGGVHVLYAWPRRHPRLLDGLLAVALVLLSGSTLGVGHSHWRLYTLVAVAMAVPIVFQHRHPEKAFIAAAAAAALQVALAPRPVFTDVSMLVLLYTLAAYRPRRTSVAGLAVCLAGAGLAIARWAPGQVIHSYGGAAQVVSFFTVPIVLAWVLGDSMRYRRGYYRALEERADRLERERDAHARIAAARGSSSTCRAPGPGGRSRDPSASGSACPRSSSTTRGPSGSPSCGWGPARGASSMVGLTLGTGVGGVIAVDGQVHQGHDGTAGEIGHQTIDPDGPSCDCGNRGCLEAFARADQIAAACGTATAEEAVRAARGGRRAGARAGLADVGRYLGIGIANMITVISPDRVVMGGGVAAAGELLFAPIRAEIARRVQDHARSRTWPSCGPSSASGPGAIGAAVHGAERAAGGMTRVRPGRPHYRAHRAGSCGRGSATMAPVTASRPTATCAASSGSAG